jgi:FkbH-like protein
MSRELDILLLANFTTSQVCNSLETYAESVGVNLKCSSGQFDQIFQELIKLEHVQDQKEVFILMRAEEFDSKYAFFQSSVFANNFVTDFIDRYQDYLEQLFHIMSEGAQHTFHVSSLFSVGPAKLNRPSNQPAMFNIQQELDRILRENLRKYPNIKWFDLESCFNETSLSERWNRSQDFLFRQPLTKQLSDRISRQILEDVLHRSYPKIKVLALDADNTLWGGVIGEDNFDSIEINHDYPGKMYMGLQEFAKYQKENGVMLALISKNNLSDVLSFFEYRKDMPLKIEDFALIEANWGPKTESLLDISRKLNILTENILFIDDSHVEIEFVRNVLPEVHTLLLSSSLEERHEQLLGLEFSWIGQGTTIEDKSRTSMVLEEQRRKNELGKLSIDEIMLKLDLQLSVRKVSTKSDRDYQRTLQLINKTNQFNLNGLRLSEKEFEALVEKESVYVAHLVDKYGSYGLIGVLAVYDNGIKLSINKYLISCRALGRGVEQSFLFYVLQEILQVGEKEIVFQFVSTGKNMQIKEFLNSIGSTWVDNDLCFSLKLSNSVHKNVVMKIEEVE